MTNKVNFVYDNYGRVSTKTYTNADNNSYTITNVYNNYGYLDQVKFDNTIVWDLTSMNERGQITQASLQGTPCTWSVSPLPTPSGIVNYWMINLRHAKESEIQQRRNVPRN